MKNRGITGSNTSPCLKCKKVTILNPKTQFCDHCDAEFRQEVINNRKSTRNKILLPVEPTRGYEIRTWLVVENILSEKSREERVKVFKKNYKHCAF